MDFLPSGPLVLANADHAAPSTSPAASSARTFSLRYPTAHDADYLSSEGGSLTSTASGDLSLKLQRPSTQRGGRAVNRKWIGRVPRPGAEVELAVVWDEKAQSWVLHLIDAPVALNSDDPPDAYPLPPHPQPTNRSTGNGPPHRSSNASRPPSAAPSPLILPTKSLHPSPAPSSTTLPPVSHSHAGPAMTARTPGTSPALPPVRTAPAAEVETFEFSSAPPSPVRTNGEAKTLAEPLSPLLLSPPLRPVVSPARSRASSSSGSDSDRGFEPVQAAYRAKASPLPVSSPALHAPTPHVSSPALPPSTGPQPGSARRNVVQLPPSYNAESSSSEEDGSDSDSESDSDAEARPAAVASAVPAAAAEAEDDQEFEKGLEDLEALLQRDLESAAQEAAAAAAAAGKPKSSAGGRGKGKGKAAPAAKAPRARKAPASAKAGTSQGQAKRTQKAR